MHTENVRANQRHENRGRAGPANRGSQSTQFQLQACRGPTVTKMAVYQCTNGRRDPSCVVCSTRCSTAVELIHSTLPVYRNACRHAYALRRLQTYRSTITNQDHIHNGQRIVAAWMAHGMAHNDRDSGTWMAGYAEGTWDSK